MRRACFHRKKKKKWKTQLEANPGSRTWRSSVLCLPAWAGTPHPGGPKALGQSIGRKVERNVPEQLPVEWVQQQDRLPAEGAAVPQRPSTKNLV